MTSPLPPKRRDTRDQWDLLRQHRTNLGQLDPGLMGGRFSPAKPVEPFLEDDEEGDDDTDVELIRFENTDTVILAADGGTPVIPLTHVPDVGSEQVFWAGDALARSDWSRTDSAVTIPAETYFKADEAFWIDYAYYDEAPEVTPTFAPATLALRGAAGDDYSTGALTSLPLPVETVVGDLIVVSIERPDVVTNSDPRLVRVGWNLFIGFANTLDDLALTCAGGFGIFWAVACATFETNATGWDSGYGATPDTPLAGGDTMAIPQLAWFGATVCALIDGHDTIAGATGAPTGYAGGADSASAGIGHSRVDFWSNGGALGTSPAGPTTFTGGTGGAIATVVALVGPLDEA